MFGNINNYIQKRNKENRTSIDYVGTTDFFQDVKDVRLAVKQNNKMLRRVGMPTVSVKVEPRLGSCNPAAEKYAGKKGAYIRIEDGDRFDIYLKSNF